MSEVNRPAAYVPLFFVWYTLNNVTFLLIVYSIFMREHTLSVKRHEILLSRRIGETRESPFLFFSLYLSFFLYRTRYMHHTYSLTLWHTTGCARVYIYIHCTCVRARYMHEHARVHVHVTHLEVYVWYICTYMYTGITHVGRLGHARA